jgi:predicted amidophosphoribosyltransferase
MNARSQTALKVVFEACTKELNQPTQLNMKDEVMVEDVFSEKDNSEFESHLCCCTGCGKQFRYDEFQFHIRFCPNCGNAIAHHPVQMLEKELVIVGGYF